MPAHIATNKHGVRLQSTRIDRSRFNRPNAAAITKGSKGGPAVDEYYLNQRIMQLNLERQRIHDLAAKYGIQNNVKVQQLQLIQIGGRPPNPDTGAPPKDSLAGITEQKDRIAEYHHRVNERRKKIHEKQAARRKERDALEQKVLQSAGPGVKTANKTASSIKKRASKGENNPEDSSSQIDDIDELEEERLRQEAVAKGVQPAKKSKKSKKKDNLHMINETTDAGEEHDTTIGPGDGAGGPEGKKDEMSATAVIAAGAVTKPSTKKLKKKQQDLDENAADDEDNEVEVDDLSENDQGYPEDQPQRGKPKTKAAANSGSDDDSDEEEKDDDEDGPDSNQGEEAKPDAAADDDEEDEDGEGQGDDDEDENDEEGDEDEDDDEAEESEGEKS